ncbi:Modification methylase HaeIII [bioreactor metagenome]|uniref:DNA (cytosine-5-)-methyltransferase n=1 Tax=bioreactor metagenome TaxID=1076179 RepID=A0A644Z5U1_9ZZZZ
MDVGFIAAKYTCLGAFDIDKKAIAVHRKNVSTNAIEADLRGIEKSQLIANGVPDVIVSGSPCQGFSTVGRRDFNDPRNSLLLRAGEIAVDIKPKIFVAENVSGALAGEHKYYWDSLDSLLRNNGYQTRTLKLNAADLGLAQRRLRIILIAWRGERELNFIQPSGGRVDLRKALGNLQDELNPNENFFKLTKMQRVIARYIKPGQKLCDVRSGASAVHTWQIPHAFGQVDEVERTVLEAVSVLRRRNRKRDWGDADPVAIREISRYIGFASSAIVSTLITKGYMRRIGHEVDLAHTFNGLYKRLNWDSISPTVDTRFGNPRYFLHPTEDRGFTVREAARIQGFPDWFTFHESMHDSFRMIGNAVPPPMAAYVAQAIRDLLK